MRRRAKCIREGQARERRKDSLRKKKRFKKTELVRQWADLATPPRGTQHKH
jgi:uncharacterized membrane-anchored protein